MASAFERSRFVGFDTHDASLEAAARGRPRRPGVADRVDFQRADAQSYPGGRYDLICFFDCLHDLGDPSAPARHALEALADDGTLMVVEPFAGDTVSRQRRHGRPPLLHGLDHALRPALAGRRTSGSRSAHRPAPRA